MSDASKWPETFDNLMVEILAEAVKKTEPKTRPSDGQPIGSKFFDVEEYETRKADRRASDPEYQKRLDAKKRAHREYWDKIADEAAHRRANESFGYSEIGPLRLLDIWTGILATEQAERILLNLPQAERIRLAPRVRGAGRAAAKAA